MYGDVKKLLHLMQFEQLRFGLIDVIINYEDSHCSSVEGTLPVFNGVKWKYLNDSLKTYIQNAVFNWPSLPYFYLV